MAACVSRFGMCQSDLPDRQAWPCCACVLLLLCLAKALTGSMQRHASAVQASPDIVGFVAPKTDCALCLLLIKLGGKLLQMRIKPTRLKPDDLLIRL